MCRFGNGGAQGERMSPRKAGASAEIRYGVPKLLSVTDAEALVRCYWQTLILSGYNLSIVSVD